MDNNGYVPDEQNDENGTTFAITRYPSGNILSSADLIKIKSRSALLRSPAFYRKILAIILCFLVVLLVGLIILGCMYSKEKKLHKICVSNECLKSAANIRLSMDTSVDPCDDFYKYTCGHWSEEHPNHGWYPRFSNFESIAERITLATLKFLQENSTPIDPLPVRQSRELYQSCMDVVSRNTLGFSSLKKFLLEVGLPVIPHYLNLTQYQNSSEMFDGDYDFDWIKADVAVKKLFAMDVFVGVSVNPDMVNRSRNIIYLGVPSQSCPLPNNVKAKQYYSSFANVEEKDDNNTTTTKDEIEDNKERKIQKNIIIYIIRSIMTNVSLILDNNTLEQTASTILDIGDELEQITADLNFSKIHNEPYRVEAIQKMSDEYLIANNESAYEIWRPYLELLFENSSVTLDLKGSDFVYMAPPYETEYLKRIALYLVQKPGVYLELYMWWMCVQAMIFHTTTDVSTYIANQKSRKSPSDLAVSRQRHCASTTINFMGMAVSYGIADRTFLRKTKPKVEQMLVDIKEAFLERLNEIDWMDKETKKATFEKCKEMISFIGFPVWLFKRGAIESYYYGVKTDKQKYLDNLIGIIRLYIPYQLKTLRKKNLKTWTTDPIDVNAFNLFTDNSITVPLAILSFPMYHLGLQVLNYGAIGTILGHELTHGFDSKGRKFDKHGNFVQWWSNKTIETFNQKTQCFIQQYNNFSFPNVEEHVQGEKTLSENLADSGGLHHAFKAYKNYLKRHGKESKLPGFENFTDEQMFFIAFGNIWCESTTPSQIKWQISGDVHSPNMARVIGTLQNSREFAEAFKCPVDSKMNPFRPRCRIW